MLSETCQKYHMIYLITLFNIRYSYSSQCLVQNFKHIWNTIAVSTENDSNLSDILSFPSPNTLTNQNILLKGYINEIDSYMDKFGRMCLE